MMGKPIISALIFFAEKERFDMISAKVHDMIEVALLFFVLWAVWKFFKSGYRSFLNRMFHAYIGKCLTNYQYRHWGEHGYPIPEVNEIAYRILKEFNDGLDEVAAKIHSHALEYGALLYCKTIHVPVHIADPNLYKAIDVLKQKFYSMYGLYFDDTDKKRSERNHFQIGVQNKKSGNLPLYFAGRTTQGIMDSLRDLKLDDPDDKDGTELVITFSVCTPYTKPGYWHKHHC
jgi:hypothetical protein